MRQRSGEDAQHQIRTNRLLETSEGWFFRTREGIEVSPYPSEFDAELGASLLVTYLAQMEPGADYHTNIRAYIADPAHAPSGRIETQTGSMDLQAMKQSIRKRRKREKYQQTWTAIAKAVRGQVDHLKGKIDNVVT